MTPVVAATSTPRIRNGKNHSPPSGKVTSQAGMNWPACGEPKTAQQ